jgi:hypothetical protein
MMSDQEWAIVIYGGLIAAFGIFASYMVYRQKSVKVAKLKAIKARTDIAALSPIPASLNSQGFF